MLLIYTSPSCSSCRKVKKWFEEQQIPYEERNIFSSTLNPDELKSMLAKSENGTEDIISTRSKIIKEENIDLDDMSINQLIEFIRKNPSILKRPIIVDDRRIQVGYNEEEIRTFIPVSKRISQAKQFIEEQCTPENCEMYGCCEHIKHNK